MRILHTADWHLGQTFYGYDRGYEHKMFLEWLENTVYEFDVDILLICGDVFDVANPSSSAQKMFYSFLKNVTFKNPKLSIVIIAGNHDSGARLEAPNALLESMNIFVTGSIKRNEDGKMEYEKMIFPIETENERVWFMAIPFLRQGDLPVSVEEETENLYSVGVKKIYDDVLANLKRKDNEAIIALGHLHVIGAEINEQDRSERIVIGGLEYTGADTFNKNITYVALGHIHKGQKIGNNIYYSGSPLPMSFAEKNYNHSVVLVEITDGNLGIINRIPIPKSVEILSIPDKPEELKGVLDRLTELPELSGQLDMINAPYLQVNVLLKGPEPSLRSQIESVLEGHHAKLARIVINYDNDIDIIKSDLKGIDSMEKLENVTPLHILKHFYKRKYNADIPEELIKLFNAATDGL